LTAVPIEAIGYEVARRRMVSVVLDDGLIAALEIAP